MGQKTQWLTKLQEGKKQAQGLKASIWDYGTNSGGRQHCSKKKKHLGCARTKGQPVDHSVFTERRDQTGSPLTQRRNGIRTSRGKELTLTAAVGNLWERTIVLHQTWMMTAVYTFRLHAARPNLKLYAGQLHQRRIPLAPSSILHRWLCPAAYHRIAKSQLFQLLLTKTVFRNNYSWISENHTAHYKWENQALSSRELHPRKRTCRSRNSWVTFFR